MSRKRKGRPLRQITHKEEIALLALKNITMGAKAGFKAEYANPYAIYHIPKRTKKTGDFNLFSASTSDELRHKEELIEYMHPELKNELDRFKRASAEALMAIMDFDQARIALVQKLIPLVDVANAHKKYEYATQGDTK